jgi:syntaxin 7
LQTDWKRKEEEAALLQQTHQVLLQVENEAATEEREQGIQEIQHQKGEVSEIFKDLAQIVANFDLPKIKHLSVLPPP